MNNIDKLSPESLASSKEIQSFLIQAAKNKLLNFCQLINRDYVAAWFHERIASILERSLEDVINKKKVRIILSIPPRHGKSVLASNYFPAWALGKYPSLKFILSTYGAELSEKMGMQTRDIISDEKYQAIFPGIKLRPDVKSKSKWMTNKDGSFTGVGIGGAVTGIGADCIIIDDPHKSREEAESATVRETVWDYYRSTLYSRLEGYGAIIVIMQRWRNDDLVGRILEHSQEMKEAGEPYDEWTVINFPAIAEEDEYDETKQLLRKQGEPLWKEKYPMDVLDNIRTNSGVYNWACTPGDAKILMADWTQKPIANIKVGDKIIGFETGTQQSRSKLVVTEVKSTFCKIDDIYDLEMDSGRKVQCTKDHKWFTGRLPTEKEPTRKKYDIPKVNRSLQFVCPVDEEEIDSEELADWNYLGAMIDGEGHIGTNTCSITQGIEKNLSVYQEIKNVLSALNISYNEYIREPQEKHHQKTSIIQLHSCRDIYRKLIKYARFGKKDQAIKAIMEKNHMFIRESDKILGINFNKRGNVYALETGTGNYISQGYASSNSQYQQSPISAETQVFRSEYFKYYEEKDLINKNLKYYTFVDPAISDKDSGDNCVVVTIAKEIDGPNIYRIREDAGHYSPQKTIDIIFKHAIEHKSDVWLETVAYQKALKFNIEEEQRKREVYFALRETSTSNKEVRISGLLPLYERGVIYHKRSDVEYEKEALQFPKGRRDDRLDAMSFSLEAMDQTKVRRFAKVFYPHLKRK